MRRKLMLSLIIANGVWGTLAFSQQTERLRLEASPPILNEHFGSSVALSANQVLIGAPSPFDDELEGAAYLYDRQTGEQRLRLVSGDFDNDDRFGSSVALSGEVALVGAPFADWAGVDSGAAYLFDINTGTLRFRFLPDSGAPQTDQFGHAVAIADNIVAIGAPRDDELGDFSGAAYLFDAGTGELLSKIFAPDGQPRDRFGYALAANDGLLLVGAAEVLGPGDAYVFRLSDGQFLFKLPNPVTERGAGFGSSVAINADFAVVGVPSLDHELVSSGAVMTFSARTGEFHSITAPLGSPASAIGTSVAQAGDFVLAGAPGASEVGLVHVFDIDSGRLVTSLEPSDPEVAQLQFGASIAAGDFVSGELPVVAGSAFANVKGRRTGSAYVFDVEPVRCRPCESPCLDPELYGEAKGGSAGVPEWKLCDCPTLGNENFFVRASGFAPGTLGSLLIGLGRDQVIEDGWTRWVNLDQVSLILPVDFVSNSKRLFLSLPNNKFLAGLRVNLQCIGLDPGAPDGVTSTSGLELILCDPD